MSSTKKNTGKRPERSTGRGAVVKDQQRLRLSVNRTAKVLIDGKFVRSESGRTYPVADSRNRFLANVPLCSRKDAREAVVAARAAQPGWERTVAATRALIVYRLAEMLQGRSAQLIDDLVGGGLTEQEARTQFDASVDRVFWYAGWADKFSQVDSSVNPVGSGFASVSNTTACGVVVVSPTASCGLLGTLEMLCAALVNGNTVVMLVDEHPLAAVTVSEAVATADIPAGVVNVLTGRRAELLPIFAAHMGVDVLDLADLDDHDPELATAAAVSATANLKRVLRTPGQRWSDEPGLARMRASTEVRTVWQTTGL